MTEQEQFWRGEFGDEYVDRNAGKLLGSNVNYFVQTLGRTHGVNSVYEIGCNIGLNLDALKILNNDLALHGCEINSKAAAISKSKGYDVENCSVFDSQEQRKFDLVMTRGVLIHLAQERLPEVYDFMNKLSAKYLLVDEYFSPNPVEIPYRGHQERMYKRDFAKEMLQQLDLEVVDYGFIWSQDPNFAQDDSNWFLLRKK